jgi:hypothetical protein
MENTVNLESTVLHSLTVLHPEEVVDVFGFLTNKGFHRTMHRIFIEAFEPCDLTPHILTPLCNFGSLTRFSATSPCDSIESVQVPTNGWHARPVRRSPLTTIELFLGDVPYISPAQGTKSAGFRALSVNHRHLFRLVIGAHRSSHTFYVLGVSSQRAIYQAQPSSFLSNSTQ